MQSEYSDGKYYTCYKNINTPGKITNGRAAEIEMDIITMFHLLWPLLLTWFNFNPSMDK